MSSRKVREPKLNTFQLIDVTDDSLVNIHTYHRSFMTFIDHCVSAYISPDFHRSALIFLDL